MGEIYLIRHGESVGNRENRFRGRHDFPLNDNGLAQARALRRELHQIRFAKIFSSPLSRALKTAEIIAHPEIQVVVEEAFNNINLGEWENRKKSEIKNEYPDLWKIWLRNPEELAFSGMETLSQVWERAFRVFLKLAKDYPDQKIAIVTHRAVIKPLFAAIFDLARPYFWKIHMDTASFSIVEHHRERGFTVTCLNQNKHLADIFREDLG